MNFVSAYIDPALVPYYKGGRVKIIFPEGSELEGFAVWISDKLLRGGGLKYGFEFFAPETFTFTATRREKRGKEWQTVEERKLTAQEFADAVGGYEVERVRVVEYTPEPLDPIDKPEPIEELLR